MAVCVILPTKGTVLISENNYTALSCVAGLPRKHYLEDQRPDTISYDRQQYLVELQLLEPRTIVPRGAEEAYPNGYVGYYLTPKGEDEMRLYEKNADCEAKQHEKDIAKRKLDSLFKVINALVSVVKLFLGV